MKKYLLALALLVVIAAGLNFVFGGVRVRVVNAGAVPLRSVVVHVTGASYPLGDIAPGESRTERVAPTSESGLAIEHAGGRLAVDAYFEPGYRGTITVKMTELALEHVENAVRIGLW
jgi:hypothetical protein